MGTGLHSNKAQPQHDNSCSMYSVNLNSVYALVS